MSHLIPLPDTREMFPDLGFVGLDVLTNVGCPLLVTDPTYLADVYNAGGGGIADYLRRNAVFILGFIGDASCPVWWQPPRLTLPVSTNGQADETRFAGATELAGEVGCDSASFMFLCLNCDVPSDLRSRIDGVLSQKNGALVDVPPGQYRFMLEQFPPPPEHIQWPHWYRDIVALRL